MKLKVNSGQSHEIRYNFIRVKFKPRSCLANCQDLFISETKPTAISLHLIVRRHLPAEAQKWSHDKMYVFRLSLLFDENLNLP